MNQQEQSQEMFDQVEQTCARQDLLTPAKDEQEIYQRLKEAEQWMRGFRSSLRRVDPASVTIAFTI